MALMKRFFHFLLNHLTYLISLYFILQLILVLFFHFDFKSDSYYYYKLAQESINFGGIYPTQFHLNEDFISAPLYINILMLLLLVWNNQIIIGLFNIILNGGIVLLLYKIAKHIFNEDAAKISMLLYVFYLNNLGLVLLNLTELFFTLLFLLSICFFLKEGKINLFISGIAASVATSVRPAGIALIIAYLIYFLFKHKKIFFVEYRYILFAFLLFLLSFGFFIKISFGHFVYTSTNGAYNLIIGSNDTANGSYKEDVFYAGNIGYIEKGGLKTFDEKSTILYNAALNWVLENPVDWIKLMPLKFIHTFVWDDIAVSHLMFSDNISLHLFLKNYFNSGSVVYNNDTKFSLIFLLLQGIHHIVYYSIFIMLLLGFINVLKTKCKFNEAILFLSVLLINTVIILVVFGSPRFKYPYFIACLPFAAYAIQRVLCINLNNINNCTT